jgi:hypothetical protein
LIYYNSFLSKDIEGVKFFMKILFLILVFGLAKNTYAQGPKIVETELDSTFNLGNRKEMESLMIWKLTSELDLEVEQAEKFFPRFRRHRNEIEALRKKTVY